jgi:hypothetical protein
LSFIELQIQQLKERVWDCIYKYFAAMQLATCSLVFLLSIFRCAAPFAQYFENQYVKPQRGVILIAQNDNRAF